MSSPNANQLCSPFGSDISSDDIVENLSFFDTWEERYKYIIELGKEIPAMPSQLKTDEHLIRGCQSQVWIQDYKVDDKVCFSVDSDAFIVKGLLAVILAAYNYKTPVEIIAFDIEDYFNRLSLLKHLSPTRGSGIKGMVARIQQIAKSALI
jgi:cysteine desulfuration protein SufE